MHANFPCEKCNREASPEGPQLPASLTRRRPASSRPHQKAPSLQQASPAVLQRPHQKAPSFQQASPEDAQPPAASLPDGDQPDPPVLHLRQEELLPQPEDRPPPREVVVEEEEEKDEDKDVLTIRQRPDNSAGQEVLPSGPRRKKRPLSKFRG